VIPNQHSMRFFLLFAAAVLMSALPCHAATYYVDCSVATDGSGMITSPWNSLATDVNTRTFLPGDQILFQRGVTCSGNLAPLGSGSAGSPITTDAYGTAARLPEIAGVPSATALHAVQLVNQSFWTINHIEVTNFNPAYSFSAKINVDLCQVGVIVSAANFGKVESITLNGLYIHDVNGCDDKKHTGESAGIAFEVDDSSTTTYPPPPGVVQSYFANVTIENSHIKNVSRNGIKLSSSWGAYDTQHTDRPSTSAVPASLSQSLTEWPSG